MERELRANLLQEARDYLLTRATREAFKLASVAPRVVGVGYSDSDAVAAETEPHWLERGRGSPSSCNCAVVLSLCQFRHASMAPRVVSRAV